MKSIGKYQGREIFWIEYSNLVAGKMPHDNWVCLATSSGDTDMHKFCLWVEAAISNGILEFKGHGSDGELLHDLFDQMMVKIEIDEGIETIDVCTTWHTDETLKDTFWQCFYATALSADVDIDKLKIVCTDLNGIDRSIELTNYLKEIESEDKE